MPVPPIRKFLSLADVSAGTIGSTTPWLVYNPATGNIEGHAAPAGGGGGTTVVAGSGANQTLRWDTGSTSYLPASNLTNDGTSVTIDCPSANATALTVLAAVGQSFSYPVFTIANSSGQQMFAVNQRYGQEPQILIAGQTFLSAESGSWLFEGRPCVFANGIQFEDRVDIKLNGAGGDGVVSIDTRVVGSGGNVGPIVLGSNTTTLPYGTPTSHKWIEFAADTQIRPGSRFVNCLLTTQIDDSLLLPGQSSSWFNESIPAVVTRIRAADGTYYTTTANAVADSGSGGFGGGN